MNSETHNHIHLHNTDANAPPQQQSMSKHKQLIKCEGQARLEWKRARLKEQIALIREWEEEESAFEPHA